MLLSFVESTLADVRLDSTGTAAVALNLSGPVMAYFEIDGKRQPLYLTPGDNLDISVLNTEDAQAMTYAGKGSAVNNYLTQVSQLQEKFITAGGKFIWELEQEAFRARLDSMRAAFAAFHQGYTDTVALPEKLSNSLENKNRLNLVSLKEEYELVHYPDRAEMAEQLTVEKSNDAFYDVPFDTTFLNNAMMGYDYGFILSKYTELGVIWPMYNSVPEEEIASAQDTFPVMADQIIRKGDYPAGIKEYLIAKNVNEFLRAQGITPFVDTIFNHFKKEYSHSPYLASLQERYGKWLAITPGQPAPDFTGNTPEGKKLSLSDLKGKVIYIDVWATWCSPCIQEFPYSRKLQQQFEGNEQVVFLYVSVDKDKDQEKWKKMLADKQLKGTHILDPREGDSSIWKAYLISGIPRYILIDQAGNIADAEASRPSSGKVKGEIEELLNETTRL